MGDDAPGDPQALRRFYRRILFFAALFPLVCGLVAPVAVPLLAFSWGDFRDGTLPLLLVGLMLSMPTSFFYLFPGVAVGCMLAPDELLDSPVGEQWLDQTGTRNPTAARLACSVAADAAIAIAFRLCAVKVLLLHKGSVGK